MGDADEQIAAALAVWREAPADAVDAVTRSVIQRARLSRLFGRMMTDPDLRHQAAQDPKSLLSAYGLSPTPQLMAAFRELDVTGMELFPGRTLDERITKLFRLLD